jgi:8-oxo-dGTP diphosphatase
MSEQTVVCIGFDGKEYVTPVSELTWRPSAYGIVLKDGKVLVSRQTNGYDLPGGGFEADETAEQAVVREVLEETGVQSKVVRRASPPITTYFKRTHKDGTCIESEMHYFVCAYVGGEISTKGFDENEKEYGLPAEWLDVSDLADITVASANDWRDLVREVAGKQ